MALAAGDQLLHADELEAAAPTPTELLSKGELGDPESYALRLQAEFLRHAYRFDPLSGLSNARIEPQPHQVFVAWRVNHKLAPRMILADEVGLGKTIEAGLIIKELRARGLANRILIVCPSSLQLQWQQELHSKFNEPFEVLDSAAMKYLGKGGAKPWARFDSVICSLPFASHRTRQDAIIESDWDLVVFDEAHRVRRWRQGKQPKVTQAYRLADELKELTTGLLLLSATPMQLDPFELYSLVELVEPGLFPSYSAYEAERDKLPHLNALMRVLQTWDALDPARAIEACDPYVGLLGGLGLDPADLLEPTVREAAADDLAAKHPLAEAMVRNRKSEIGGFVGRHASSHMIALSAEELDLYQDITDYIRFTYDQAMATKNQAMGFLMVAYQKMLASSTHAIRASFEKRIKKLKLPVQEQVRRDAHRADRQGRPGCDRGSRLPPEPRGASRARSDGEAIADYRSGSEREGEGVGCEATPGHDHEGGTRESDRAGKRKACRRPAHQAGVARPRRRSGPLLVWLALRRAARRRRPRLRESQERNPPGGVRRHQVGVVHRTTGSPRRRGVRGARPAGRARRAAPSIAHDADTMTTGRALDELVGLVDQPERLVTALDTVFGYAHALSGLTAQVTVGRGRQELLRAEGCRPSSGHRRR